MSLGNQALSPSTRKVAAIRGPVFLLLAVSAALPHLYPAQDDWKKRDAWQRPAEVMDELGIKPGSVVADVGAGNGYFSFHLAARVGLRGKVYAVDIQDDLLKKIRRRAKKEGVAQIETIPGAADDPRLPAETLDAILVVNAYHEMRKYDAMMKGMYRALKPGGLLGIIEPGDTMGQPRRTYQERHTIPEALVREDAARNGFRFLRETNGFANPNGKRWYFQIFDKPKPENDSSIEGRQRILVAGEAVIVQTRGQGVNKGEAKRMGMPKFEPPKPLTTAYVTPMTLPSLLNSGPPEPPEVVCAS